MSRLYGKIFRGLIEEENKSEEEQSGFRTRRTCTHNTFALNKLLKKGMQRTKKPIYYLWILKNLMTVYQYLNFGKFWEIQRLIIL